MIQLCREAGAGKITVFEHTIDRPAAQVLAVSGIAAAARQEGAELIYGATEGDFAPIMVPRGKMMKQDTLARAVLGRRLHQHAQGRHHSQTRLTLGLKNLMGSISTARHGTRVPTWPSTSPTRRAVAVDLTVMDASRILVTNGPKGPGTVREPEEVIVSFDGRRGRLRLPPVRPEPSSVAYIGKAVELGQEKAIPRTSSSSGPDPRHGTDYMKPCSQIFFLLFLVLFFQTAHHIDWADAG